MQRDSAVNSLVVVVERLKCIRVGIERRRWCWFVEIPSILVQMLVLLQWWRQSRVPIVLRRGRSS